MIEIRCLFRNSKHTQYPIKICRAYQANKIELNINEDHDIIHAYNSLMRPSSDTYQSLSSDTINKMISNRYERNLHKEIRQQKGIIQCKKN